MDINFITETITVPNFPPARLVILAPPKDTPTASDMATLQALYSRNPQPIDSAAKLLKASKSGEFFDKFYVGYSHNSIGQCGVVYLALENVPLWFAKLIQHSPLYNGQEASTRFLDFSTQPMATSEQLQARVRAFLAKATPQVAETLATKFSLSAAGAKPYAFDIVRGFLPVNTCTSLSWTTTLDHFNEHVARMLQYVGTIKQHTKQPGNVKEYTGRLLGELSRMLMDYQPGTIALPRHVHNPIQPPPTNNHTYLQTPFHNEYSSLLDLGSWRNLARHRAVEQTFANFWQPEGLEAFYPQHLPTSELQNDAEALLQFAWENENELLLCARTPFTLRGPRWAFQYMTKLRTRQDVHQTLRNAMYRMAQCLNLPTAPTATPEWTPREKRATQTLTPKEGATN